MTIPRQWPNGVQSMTIDSTTGLPKLLFSDMSALDANMQRALDKTAAGGTLSGVLTLNTFATLSFDGAPSGLFINGAASALQTASGGRFLCGDNDVPVFSAARSYTRVIDILEYADFASTLTSPTTNQWSVDNAALTVKPTIASSTLWVPITRAWDGATLSSVSVYFIVDGTRGGLPFFFPSMQVFRYDPFKSNPFANGGNVTADMALRANLAGQAFPPAANITAYINGGVPNVMTFTCSANNVVDTANYCYFVQINDENYSGAGGFIANKFVGMLATYTTVTDTRFQ
jgi:hypothetical protein